MIAERMKAVAVLALCFAVFGTSLGAKLAEAKAEANAHITDKDVQNAAFSALNSAIGAAVSSGGLENAEDYISANIRLHLEKAKEKVIVHRVEIIRKNAFSIYATWYFDVKILWTKTSIYGKSENSAGGAICTSARVYLDGYPDPLLCIRLGIQERERYRLMRCPYHPYALHGNLTLFADCLSRHYYHVSKDGSDFFARLENRSSDPDYYGFEVFITGDPLKKGEVSCVDHIYLDAVPLSSSLLSDTTATSTPDADRDAASRKNGTNILTVCVLNAQPVFVDIWHCMKYGLRRK